MLEQRVQNRPLTGPRGAGLIALTAAAVWAGSVVFDFLGRFIGAAASALFILWGACVAWFLLNRYVLAFVYTCHNGCLRVCRAYGRRERLMADIWLNGIQACGPLEAMRARFPGARLQRAVKSQCPIEPLAVAYNDAGSTALMLMQPDEPLKKIILAAVKK